MCIKDSCTFGGELPNSVPWWGDSDVVVMTGKGMCFRSFNCRKKHLYDFGITIQYRLYIMAVETNCGAPARPLIAGHLDGVLRGILCFDEGLAPTPWPLVGSHRGDYMIELQSLPRSSNICNTLMLMSAFYPVFESTKLLALTQAQMNSPAIRVAPRKSSPRT